MRVWCVLGAYDAGTRLATDVYDEQWFLERCDIVGECWIWKGSKNRDGYGQIRRKLVPEQYAHRWAYACLVGTISSGLQIDHLCGQPSCIRPSHLEPVSGRTNWERSNSPSRINSKKTHCKRGHALTPDAIYVNNRGSRVCKECHRLGRHRSPVTPAG